MPELTTQQLRERLSSVETAVISLATAEFGDVTGHVFHGNQYADLGSMTDSQLKAHHENLKNGVASAKDEIARRAEAARSAKAAATPGRGPVAEHAVKGKRESEIVDTARAQGLIGPKQYSGTYGLRGDRYGTQDNRAAILPTSTKINLNEPENGAFPDHASGSFLVAQSGDTGHLRAIGIGDANDAGAAIGDKVFFQHDQTRANIGQSAHEIVGIRYPDGTAEGVIPDRKIAYSVFK